MAKRPLGSGQVKGCTQPKVCGTASDPAELCPKCLAEFEAWLYRDGKELQDSGYAQARPTPVTPPATMPKGDGGQP